MPCLGHLGTCTVPFLRPKMMGHFPTPLVSHSRRLPLKPPQKLERNAPRCHFGPPSVVLGDWSGFHLFGFMAGLWRAQGVSNHSPFLTTDQIMPCLRKKPPLMNLTILGKVKAVLVDRKDRHTLPEERLNARIILSNLTTSSVSNC